MPLAVRTFRRVRHRRPVQSWCVMSGPPLLVSPARGIGRGEGIFNVWCDEMESVCREGTTQLEIVLNLTIRDGLGVRRCISSHSHAAETTVSHSARLARSLIWADWQCGQVLLHLLFLVEFYSFIK